MINKQLIQSIISKYHLDVNESVKWVIEDGVLSIDFMTPSRDVIGNIKCVDFDLDGVELAIFNTKKLSNLLNICDDEILFKVKSTKHTPTKLFISDSRYNLEYALASPLVIDSVGTVNDVEWDVKVVLDDEDIINLIKAKSAVNDSKNMRIISDINADQSNVINFVFGDEDGHNNSITYQTSIHEFKNSINLPFNSDMFKNILKSNKDGEVSKVYISSQGLMKMVFKGESITSTYYIVRSEEVNF